MKAKEIVELLAKDRVIEKLISHYNTSFKEDLAQNLYISLLGKDDDFLTDLYNSERINYYLVGAIKKEILSNHSLHCRENRKAGLIKGEVTPIYDERKNYEDIADDENETDISDDVDKFLNTLTPLEKEIAWLIPMLNYDNDKKEQIDTICANYNISYRKYQKLLPKIKKKFQDHFKVSTTKKEFEPRIKNEVLQIDKNGKIIAVYDNSKDAANKLGLNFNSIRRCCNGDRKTYKGYIFKFKKDFLK